MNKKVFLSLLMITITCILIFAYNINNSRNNLKKGLYVYVKNDEEVTTNWSWIKIEDNNKFIFHRGLGISYRPTGEYEIKEDMLLLKVNDQVEYEFEIKDKSITLIRSKDEYFDTNIVFNHTDKSVEEFEKTLINNNDN
ncbi:MAG: hypothetical protein N4A63_09070 [Vallitalea sp.]|jgi:hypothetical protein|nr:hypothetical protein [Vallitalea sp.]